MTSSKRVGVAVASLGLVATTFYGTPASAATKTETIDPALTQINLLNITDFHGRIDDKGALACTVETAKATLGEDRTILVSTGDNIGATPFVSSSQADIPTIEYLNALELKTSSAGNHELDRGFADLTGRVKDAADYSITAANLYERGTTTPAVDAYDVIEVNGVQVGVIGAITRETATLVSPAGIQGVDFGDPVEAVNRVAAQLTDGDPANGEADILVAQYHDGGANRDAILAGTSDKVSVITMGHTHETFVGTGDRAEIQSKQYGEALGTVQLGYDAATKTVKQYVATVDPVNKTISEACTTDPQYVAARKVADEAIAQSKIVGAQKVGEISADITTAMKDAAVDGGKYTGTARDDRMRESTLGNLTAQIWLDAMNEPGRTGADIGIMNPGGLRDELYYKAVADRPGDADGVVTLMEAASINPFANTLQTVEVTGAQFKKLLEQQWQPEGSSRPFLKLGLSDNVRYTYDASKPAGERITSVTYDGEPMDMAATFKVASGSFLLSGGDNFTVLAEGKNHTDSGLIDTDAFVNYFAKNSPVAPDFEKNGVEVLGSTTVQRGQLTKLVVQGVDLTSVGAPANTSFDVIVDGHVVGGATIATEHVDGVPTRDGVSTLEFNVPKALLGDTVTLTSSASGTEITLKLAPLPVKTFRDVAKDNQFYTEIVWAGSAGISTGWDGVEFRPEQPIDRDAMAAFLYRMAGSPEFDSTGKQTFTDVPETMLYHHEIEWLAATGIATGWEHGDGTRTYGPQEPINRDAMAAFMYRMAGSPAADASAQPFTDVPSGLRFEKEIEWMAAQGISTGWVMADGSAQYRPFDPVNRDAMAAFLYRYSDNVGLMQAKA